YRGHHAVCFREGCDLRQRLGSHEQLCPRSRAVQELSQLAGGRGVRQRGVCRLELADLLGQLGGVAVGADRNETEAIGIARDHIARVRSARAGGTQNGNSDQATTPSNVSPKNNTGTAPVTLSIRSITPPWPGNRVPLSFTPAKRFRRLSVRSPTME